MANQRIGNTIGVAAVSTGGNTNKTNMNGTGFGFITSVTADGVNTVTVVSIELLRVGMLIDILTRSNLAVVASSRTITNIASTGVITYDGADVAATTADGIYFAGQGQSNEREYVDPDFNSIASMKARLTAIDSGFYTAARLNTMTYNDMVFAIRTNDAPTTIKQ